LPSDVSYHDNHDGHIYAHEGVDPSIATAERAILAIKWSSFVGLFVNVLV
jgi:hypothetical protein